MPADRRTDEEIRTEIATEREKLAGAVADLRAGIDTRARQAAVVGAALATGLVVAKAVKVVLRRRSLL